MVKLAEQKAAISEQSNFELTAIQAEVRNVKQALAPKEDKKPDVSIELHAKLEAQIKGLDAKIDKLQSSLAPIHKDLLAMKSEQAELNA